MPRPRRVPSSRMRMILEQEAGRRNVFSRGPDMVPGPFSRHTTPTLVPVSREELSDALRAHRKGERTLYVNMGGRLRKYSPLGKKVVAIRRVGRMGLKRLQKEATAKRHEVVRLKKRVNAIPHATLEDIYQLVPHMLAYYDACSQLAATEFAYAATEVEMLNNLQRLTGKLSVRYEAAWSNMGMKRKEMQQYERLADETEKLGPDIKLYRKFFLESAKWRKKVEELVERSKKAIERKELSPKLVDEFYQTAFNYYNRSVQRLTRELVIYNKSGILFEGRTPKKIRKELTLSHRRARYFQKRIKEE